MACPANLNCERCDVANKWLFAAEITVFFPEQLTAAVSLANPGVQSLKLAVWFVLPLTAIAAMGSLFVQSVQLVLL